MLWRGGKSAHMWQCITQMPGLSVLNAMINVPFAGRTATSRRGGLSKFQFAGFAGSNLLSLLCAMMAKSWPWRWIGWGS